LKAYYPEMAKDLYTRLVYARQLPILGKLAYYALKMLGTEIPISVAVGKRFQLEHGGVGVVIHSKTRIGSGVKIYPQVTVGRADIHLPIERSRFQGVVVEDEVILCTGAKVLGKEGILRVGRGTVVGANAVLLQSTGENEIWAGIPARILGRRDGEAFPEPTAIPDIDHEKQDVNI
jgi:serine O-acetyltransferase